MSEHPQHEMHVNSLDAFREEFPTLSKREAMILQVIRISKHEWTVRQMQKYFGFADRNAVAPRITELLDAGLLEECGTVIDEYTGKRVCKVRATHRVLETQQSTAATQGGFIQMSVWFVVPSKRPFSECDPTLELWRKQGYRVGLWRDEGDVAGFLGSEVLIERKYEGYSIAVNELVKYVLSADPEASWIVTGGDDVQPDPGKRAEEIARECSQHFFKAFDEYNHLDGTFGVMQPTGDRWGDTAHARAMFGEERGASIDRICGSPWMGREFCKRAYGGRGPMWPEYFHMFNDEELQEVAIKLGCFWQRRDLVHLHQHWGRGPESNPNAPAALANQPEFLKYAAGPENWKKMKEIFLRRKAAGFPGHEPL